MTTRAHFDTHGYAVVRGQPFRGALDKLRARFQDDFASRFTQDATHNRNLIKRFGDSMQVAQLYSSDQLQALLGDVGIADPVACGPMVTHYTSHNATGQSYGLPLHQDWPSMGSSHNCVIAWVCLTDSGPDSHGLQVVPGMHRHGVLEGDQKPDILTLEDSNIDGAEVLQVASGDLLLLSPFLPHRTYVNPEFSGWKLSLSRRFDDLNCPHWPTRNYANAYNTVVDRELYKDGDEGRFRLD